MEYAVMDNKGIIETFNSEDEAVYSLDRIRDENDDIEGDLLVIKILFILS